MNEERFVRLKTTVQKILNNVKIETLQNGSLNFQKQFKLFGGEIKEWLPFWAQFKKIHNDKEIENEDKYQYLLQATLKGSRTREIVESYPVQ